MRFNESLKMLCFMVIFVFNQVCAETINISINSEQWDVPRHGEALIKQSELGRIVRLWSLQPDNQIEIHYPGGEEGELWVQELMDWLVALGVPSEAILHSKGSGSEDIIKLELNLDSKQVKGNKVDE